MDPMTQQILETQARELVEAHDAIANLLVWGHGINQRLSDCEAAILLLGDSVKIPEWVSNAGPVEIQG